MEIWIHFVNLNLFCHTAVAYWLLRKWSVPAEGPPQPSETIFEPKHSSYLDSGLVHLAGEEQQED